MSIGTKILNKIVSLAQATGGQVEGNKDVTDEMKTLQGLSRKKASYCLKTTARCRCPETTSLRFSAGCRTIGFTSDTARAGTSNRRIK